MEALQLTEAMSGYISRTPHPVPLSLYQFSNSYHQGTLGNVSKHLVAVARVEVCCWFWVEEVKVAIIPYPIMPRAGSPTSENVWALELGVLKLRR